MSSEAAAPARAGRRLAVVRFIAHCLVVAMSGAAPAVAATVETEADFLARCQAEGGVECAVRWRWAGNAGPMAEALIALSRAPGGGAPSDARAKVKGATWSSSDEGKLDEATVRLISGDAIAFRWMRPGSEGRYDLIQALRIRGVALETLGCPEYPMYTMGQEKVMLARPEGRAPFVVTVYVRPAPTSGEFGVFAADADFAAAPPDHSDLQAGRYPGAGERDFAILPVGWVPDCVDPGN